MPQLGVRSTRALAAAVAVAEREGLAFSRPIVLRDGANLIVHLSPAPVVARVSTVTGTMRPGPDWIARELAVDGHLNAVGAPVVAPSDQLAPGPHTEDGFALSFWEYIPAVDEPVDPVEAGRRLHTCHEALADFRGDLHPMAPLQEAMRILDTLTGAGAGQDATEAFASPEALARLRRVGITTRAAVDRVAQPVQAVHGDAHLGNVLPSPRGPLWNDWEDAFLGPRVWDLACMASSAPPFGNRDAGILAAVAQGYARLPKPAVLDPFIDARRFQVCVWGIVAAAQLGQADPQLEARAAWLEQQDARAA